LRARFDRAGEGGVAEAIKFAIDTHHHRDHAYGNAVFTRMGATTIAHAAAHDFTPPASGLSAHLLHVGIGVSDMSRAVEFYSTRFGFKEIFRRPDNKVLIMRVPGAREDWVEFILKGEQGSDRICLAGARYPGSL